MEEWLGRIGVAGVTTSAILSGFGLVSTPYSQVAWFRKYVRRCHCHHYPANRKHILCLITLPCMVMARKFCPPYRVSNASGARLRCCGLDRHVSDDDIGHAEYELMQTLSKISRRKQKLLQTSRSSRGRVGEQHDRSTAGGGGLFATLKGWVVGFTASAERRGTRLH